MGATARAEKSSTANDAVHSVDWPLSPDATTGLSATLPATVKEMWSRSCPEMLPPTPIQCDAAIFESVYAAHRQRGFEEQAAFLGSALPSMILLAASQGWGGVTLEKASAAIAAPNQAEALIALCEQGLNGLGEWLKQESENYCGDLKLTNRMGNSLGARIDSHLGFPRLVISVGAILEGHPMPRQGSQTLKDAVVGACALLTRITNIADSNSLAEYGMFFFDESLEVLDPLQKHFDSGNMEKLSEGIRELLKRASESDDPHAELIWPWPHIEPPENETEIDSLIDDCMDAALFHFQQTSLLERIHKASIEELAMSLLDGLSAEERESFHGQFISRVCALATEFGFDYSAVCDFDEGEYAIGPLVTLRLDTPWDEAVCDQIRDILWQAGDELVEPLHLAPEHHEATIRRLKLLAQSLTLMLWVDEHTVS